MSERRRAFIRANTQLDDNAARWDLPLYDEKTNAPHPTALNYDPTWHPLAPKDDEFSPQLDLSSLTADSLEKIREFAVEEGKEEGRKQGFEQGKQEGFAQGKQEGIEQGKQEGLAQGLAEGQALIASQCQQLEVLCTKLAQPIEQVNEQLEYQLIEIVAELAAAIIQTELVTNKTIILSTLKQAILALPAAHRQIDIYLHPDDLNIVEKNHTEQEPKHKWTFHADANLQRGDIHLTSKDSIVDYPIDARVKQLIAQFLGQNLPKKSEGSTLQNTTTNVVDVANATPNSPEVTDSEASSSSDE